MIQVNGPPEARPGPTARRPARAGARGGHWLDALLHPRTLVFLVLILAVIAGGGHKLLAAWRARRAANRLARGAATPEDIRSAGVHGRATAPELMDLLRPERDAPTRAAAGVALAQLWVADELVAEEEQAIVRVGHRIECTARRVYPRELRRPIPLGVRIDICALAPGSALRDQNLQVAWKLDGARRLSYERYSAWTSPGEPFEFVVDPGDLPGRGPHRLAVGARVRTVGLTGAWELELGPRDLAIEFDEHLRVDAILTLPDAERGALMARAVRLRPSTVAAGEPGVDFGGGMVAECPMELVCEAALPCDLAHRVALEIDGHTGLFECEPLVWPGAAAGARHPIWRAQSDPADQGVAPPRAGVARVRIVMEPDPERGWVHPAIRSVWPGKIVTDWQEIGLVRL
jgi:hypothetical protein